MIRDAADFHTWLVELCKIAEQSDSLAEFFKSKPASDKAVLVPKAYNSPQLGCCAEVADALRGAWASGTGREN
jgi:hypothetical protein